MAVSLRERKTGSNSVTLTNSPNAGDIVIVATAAHPDPATPAVTGTVSGAGATWEQLYTWQAGAGANTQFAQVWIGRALTGTGPITASYSQAGRTTGMVVWHLAGADSADPVVSAVPWVSGTTLTGPSDVVPVGGIALDALIRYDGGATTFPATKTPNDAAWATPYVSGSISGWTVQHATQRLEATTAQAHQLTATIPNSSANLVQVVVVMLSTAVTITGTLATETDAAQAGSLTVGSVIVGTLASETDLGLTGSALVGQVVAGTLATETDTALAGAMTTATLIGGTLATETDTALTGAIVAGSVIAGTLATETDEARTGTSTLGALVAGGQAAELDTAMTTPSAPIVGSMATETDTAQTGVVVRIIRGGIALEQDSGGWGTVHVQPPVVPAPLPAAGHAMVVAQAFGAQTMHGAQPVYSISQAHIPRTRQQIIFDGVDITYHRNFITPDVRPTLIEPLLYGPADIDLPQVASTEEFGVDDLVWLRAKAEVVVNDVLDDVIVRTAWKGFANGLNIDGGSVSVELGGEAHGRAELRNRQAVIVPRVNDLGHQLADGITDLGLSHDPPLGVETGIEVMTTGGMGYLEWFQGLIAKAWTRAGRQWTVMPNEETGSYETHRKDGTTIHATAFIDDARTVLNVRRDISEEPNRIFGTGITPNGMRVRNSKIPGIYQGPTPDFPGHMEMGDTGEGVRLLIGRLHAMGYVGLRDTGGGYDEDIYEAVVELQRDAGFFEDGFTGTAVPGEVNLATWRALYDLDVTTTSLEWAHIEPMAQTTKVRPWRRSGSGTIMGVNPGYDANEIPVERNIDYGVSQRRAQMFERSRTELAAANDPNWLGDITFHTGALLRGEVAVGAVITEADVMEAKELRPGMNVWVPNFQGGTLFHVAAARPAGDVAVTATIDTRFRDAAEVWEIQDRNKETKSDLARRRNMAHRSSTIVKDSIGEIDEHGGILGNDVKLKPGWNLFEVMAAMEGTVSRTALTVQTVTLDGESITVEGHQFAMAVFGRPVTEEWMNNLIPEPLTNAGTEAWEEPAIRDQLDAHWLLHSAGTKDEPCGFSPGRKSRGATCTGRHVHESSWRYASEDRAKLYVLVWVGNDAEDAVIPLGRVFRPQLEAGV